MTEVGTRAAIEVTEDGPYHVTGGVPLRRVRKVEGGRKGSYVEWEVYEEVDAPDEYWLCRCGLSETKPFCSGAHSKAGFDGAEAAPADTYAERSEVLGGTEVTVRDDRSICSHASYCANEITNVWKAARKIDGDEDLRSVVVRMIENCPSGALSYEAGGRATEPPLEPEILVQEDGPYLVRGAIPITRADGQPLESRNRMTVCRCGHSDIKPLCDGSHAESGFSDR